MKEVVSLSEKEQIKLLKQEKNVQLELVKLRSHKPSFYKEKDVIENNKNIIKRRLKNQDLLLKNQVNILSELNKKNPKFNRIEKQFIENYNRKPKITNLYNLFQSEENIKEYLQKNMQKEILILRSEIKQLEDNNTKLTSRIRPAEVKYDKNVVEKSTQLQNIRKIKEKYLFIDYKFKESLTKQEISEIKEIQKKLVKEIDTTPSVKSKIILEANLEKSKRILHKNDRLVSKDPENVKFKDITGIIL